MNAAELKELQRVIETQVVPELDAWLQLWREAEQQQPGSMHLDLQAEKVGNDRTKRTATVSKIVNAYIYEAFRAAVPQLFEAARARALQTLVEARVEAERTAIKELEAVRAQLQVETPFPVCVAPKTRPFAVDDTFAELVASESVVKAAGGRE